MQVYKKNRIRKNSAFSLVESVVAASVTVILVSVAVESLMVGVTGWARGEQNMASQQNAQLSIVKVIQSLRTAVNVNVSANGLSLTYELPVKDASGNFTSPAVWDGVQRQITLVGTNLEIIDPTGTTVICKNVVLTDPLHGGAAYKIFTPNVGAITRQVTIMVVSQDTVPGSVTPVFGRRRETVYLRNIQTISN